MKIYNEDKTHELFDPDLEKGYLYDDKRLVKHHDAIPEKVIKTVEEQVEEYRAQGKEVIQSDFDLNYYLTISFTPRTGNMGADGREGKQIEPIVEPAVDAWDEYEDIQVYHPYTDEEYKEYLRAERESVCFSVINRGAAWYARLTPEQNEELQTWYQAWLDAPETGIKPETPSWI